MIAPKPTYQLPLFISHISAGPPSPADSTIDQNIDLNEFLIKNPTATFNIVIAVVGGEFLVKRLITECGVKYLLADGWPR